jgi:hypothetical protein
MAHKEIGFELLEKLTADLAELIEVDSRPRSDRNLLSMVVSPKKEIDKIVAKNEAAYDVSDIPDQGDSDVIEE